MTLESASPEGLAKRSVRQVAGRLPFSVGITGRARDGLLKTMDLAFYRRPQTGLEEIVAADGRRFTLRLDRPNERLASYFLENLLRNYRRSPLFGLLQEVWKEQGPGATFVDVGANLGMYCLLAKDLGFQTVAIDPEPSHSAFLMRHDAYFDRVFNVAVGDENGEAEFFVSHADNPGASSLVVGDAVGIYEQSVTVGVRRLDEVLGELACRGASVRVLKIDVEGFEASAVGGMVGLLERGHRPLIWCEVRGPSSDRAPNSYREVCSLLRPFGYEAFSTKGRFKAFVENEAKLPQVFDLLFRKSSDAAET